MSRWHGSGRERSCPNPCSSRDGAVRETALRRPAPRPLGEAVERVSSDLAPPSLLGSVQGLWERAAGDAVARESEPTAERDGVVTITCRSAVWAQELDLLSDELLGRLNMELGGAPEAPSVRALRFVASSGRGGRRRSRRRF